MVAKLVLSAAVIGTLGLTSLSAQAGAPVAWPETPTAIGPTRAALAQQAQNPEQLYGSNLRFTIERNGNPVGTHTVQFSREGDDLIVDAQTRIQVKLAFITVFRFEYDSRSVWRDGSLMVLDSTVNDDGSERGVSVRRNGDVLNISGSKGNKTAPGWTVPTNHWNAVALGSTRVINTITGGLNSVTMIPGEKQAVPTGSGPREATPVAYTGELRTKVWYDDDGRWVRLEFPANDGSTITYRCEQCGPPNDLADRDGAGSARLQQ